MPQGALTPIQGALATALTQAQTALMDAQAVNNLVGANVITDINNVITSIQRAQALVAGGGTLDQSISQDATAVTNLSAQLTTCQQQLAAATIPKVGIVQTPTPGTPATSTNGQTQTYVSAPAVGALMAVSAILGAAGGYAGKSYLDKRRHGAAEEAPRRRVRARKSVKEMGDAE